MTDAQWIEIEPLRRTGRRAVVGASRGQAREALALETAADTPFRIASLTKPVTAVATLLALGRAGLTADTPAIELLPDLRETWRADKRLTVGDVLSQTSGLRPTVTAADIAQLGDSDGAATEAARLTVAAGNVRSPGMSWEYYNGNYFLAGAMIAALSGTTYEAAVNDLVLRSSPATWCTRCDPSSLLFRP